MEEIHWDTLFESLPLLNVVGRFDETSPWPLKSIPVLRAVFRAVEIVL